MRERQAAAGGRLAFAPGELAATLERLEEAVVRPAAGVAYVPAPVVADVAEPLRLLQEHVRAAFDPNGILSGAA